MRWCGWVQKKTKHFLHGWFQNFCSAYSYIYVLDLNPSLAEEDGQVVLITSPISTLSVLKVIVRQELDWGPSVYDWQENNNQ